MSIIEKGEYDKFIEVDQLNISKGNGTVFDGFKEAKLNFAPTFKVRLDEYSDRIAWAFSSSTDDAGVHDIACNAVGASGAEGHCKNRV